MKRIILACLFFLATIIWVSLEEKVVNGQPITNDQLDSKITELENEIEILEEKYNIEKELNNSTLDNEKSNSSKIYNASMFFIAIVGLFVAVGGVVLSVLIAKLNSHQRKIDLVLDSKDFDDKVKAIDQRLNDMRMKERQNIKIASKRQFKIVCKQIEEILSTVEFVKNDRMLDEDILKNILDKYEWEYITSSYQEEKDSFNDLVKLNIDPLDDFEEDIYNPEEELVWHLEEIEVLLVDFEKIEQEITEEMQ